jgi:hypothetical protein
MFLVGLPVKFSGKNWIYVENFIGDSIIIFCNIGIRLAKVKLVK